MSCDGGLPAKIKGSAPPLTENQCQPPQTYFVWVCGELSTSWRIFFCQEFWEVVIQPWLVWHSLGRRWEDEFKMRIEDFFKKIHYKSTQLYADFKGGMSSRWVYDYVNIIWVHGYMLTSWVFWHFWRGIGWHITTSVQECSCKEVHDDAMSGLTV